MVTRKTKGVWASWALRKGSSVKFRNLKFPPTGPPHIKGFGESSAQIQLEGFTPKITTTELQVGAGDVDVPGVSYAEGDQIAQVSKGCIDNISVVEVAAPGEQAGLVNVVHESKARFIHKICIDGLRDRLSSGKISQGSKVSTIARTCRSSAAVESLKGVLSMRWQGFPRGGQ